MPAIQRFVNAAFAAEMTGDDATLQADYVPLSPHRADDDSQPAVVALPVPKPYAARGPLKASARAIEASLPDAVGAFIAWLIDERNGWQVAERRRRRRRDAGCRWPAAAHRRAVPPVRQLRRGRHAHVHRRHRGARHPAPARRRQGVPRSRRGRDDPRGAGGHRMARRRAVGVRDAARVRCSPSTIEQLLEFRHRFGVVASVPHSARARRQLGAGSGADRRADDAPDADCRRAAAAAAAASAAQLPAGRRHHRPAARRNARARRLHPAAGRRAGAGQRAARRRARAAVRSGAAASRSAASSTSCGPPRSSRRPKRRSSKRAATACG